MKRTILNKLMVILGITFLYFNIEIEGMKEEQDKHYNFKKSLLKRKPEEVVDPKDNRKNCCSRFKEICNNLSTNCQNIGQWLEYYSNSILLNTLPGSESNTGIKYHDPFNEIFDDNIQNEQQGTLRYNTGRNLNILNPEPLFYNTNPFETQTTKQPDKDLPLLSDKTDFKEEKEEKCKICFKKYEEKTNISEIELNASYFSRRKICLPCCKKDLCTNCKSDSIEKGNLIGLEILLRKSIYDIKQIKCMRCPFCCALIPQKENDNGSLWEIQNNSIKLHEKIELLKKGDEETVTSIIQEAKNNPYYFKALKEKLLQEDQQLFEEISVFYSLDLNF